MKEDDFIKCIIRIVKILLLILDLMFINWKYKLNNPQKKKFSLFGGCLLYFSILKQQNYRYRQQSFQQNRDYKKNYIKDFQFSPDSSLLAFATNKGAFIQDIITSQILQNFQVSKCCLLICFLGKEQLAIVLSGQLVLYDIKDLQQTKLLSKKNYKFVYLVKIAQLWQTCQNNSKLNYQYLIIEKYQEMKFLIQKKIIGMGIGQDIQFISLENTIPVKKIFYLIEQNYHVGYYYQNFSQDSNILSILTANLIYFQLEICSNKILKQINFNKFNSKFCALNQQETMIILSKNKYQQFDLVEQKLLLIELETQKVISCFEEVLDQKFQCIDSIFSQDQLNFVASYQDLRIKLWDTKSCKLLSYFKTDTERIDMLTISSRAMQQLNNQKLSFQIKKYIYIQKFSTLTLLAQTNYNIINLWDLKTLKQQQFEMDGHSYSVNKICISSDGFQMVTGSSVDIIRWDLVNQKSLMYQ
ncbi:unnamed protein product [Paramecium pentaurelia]|uniref:WD40-repeat-containing domain n=1 Tax=Paramecium pentaurelia TaxID=43138 RepID=A0A8S1T2Q3_9CILI|nr:unnamed protein product [Paramecium pentaurelia]